MVLEDYSNAQEYFKLALEEDPEDYQVLYNLLYCFEFQRSYEEAITVLNAVLEKNPYNEIAWHEIGKQYLNLDRNEEALSAFDFAIISEDQFTGAYIEKGKVLENMGRYNEAIENFQMEDNLMMIGALESGAGELSDSFEAAVLSIAEHIKSAR